MTVDQAGPLTVYYASDTGGDVAEFDFQFLTAMQATVTGGGTDQPASGTAETLTVQTTSTWPDLQPGQTLYVMDYAELGSPYGYELMQVGSLQNGDAATWQITRGAQGTPTTAHSAGWTIIPVQVSSPAVEPRQIPLPANPTSLQIAWTVTPPSGIPAPGATSPIVFAGSTTPAAGTVWRSGTGLYRTWIDLTASLPANVDEALLTVQAETDGIAKKIAPRWATIKRAPI